MLSDQICQNSRTLLSSSIKNGTFPLAREICILGEVEFPCVGAGVGSAAGLGVAAVVVAAGVVAAAAPPPPVDPGFFFSLILSLTAATHSLVVCSLSEKITKVRLAVDTVKWYFFPLTFEDGSSLHSESRSRGIDPVRSVSLRVLK